VRWRVLWRVWCGGWPLGARGTRTRTGSNRARPASCVRTRRAATDRQAAVHGFGSVGELRALRREAAAAGLHPAPKLLGPRPPPAAGPVWDERAQAYTLPFPGVRWRACVHQAQQAAPRAPTPPPRECRVARTAAAGADASVVRRTQSALSAAGLPAVHFSVRFAVPSRLALLRFLGYGGLMSLLASWSWGRRLLLA
jgi:hypothetical protein